MRLFSGTFGSLLCLAAACGGSSKDSAPAGGGDGGDGGAGASSGRGPGGGRASGGEMPGVGGSSGAGGVPALGGSAGASGMSEVGGRGGAGDNSGTGGGAGAGGRSGTGGGAGAGGASGSGGRAGAGGSGGGFTDATGDASRPELDLVSGAIYRDGDFFEFRLQFAGPPLIDGAGFAVDAVSWTLSGIREGAGLSLRFLAGSLSVGLDACTHVLIDEATHRLIVRVPVAIVSPTPTFVSFDTSSGGSGTGGDSIDRVPWAPLGYPGALPNAAPACEPWSSARRSTLAFRDISIGDGFGCGITLAGEAVCWGQQAALTMLGSAPAGPFEQVSVSQHSWWQTGLYACGRRADGQITCWGMSPPTLTGTYRSMGDSFGCAIRDDGDLACIDMGTGEDEIRSAIGPIAKVVGAGTEACHLTEAGVISCFGQSTAPTGNDFIDVAFGSITHACGLRESGRLECELASRIPYRLTSIGGGDRPRASFVIGCGLTEAGSPVCWGGAGVVPPVHPGPFVRLEVSRTTEGFCGFRANSTLVCWDYSHVAGTPVPATSPP